MCGNGLVKSFFGNNPHANNLGQIFLNVNNVSLELVVQVTDASREVLNVLGIEAPEEM